MEVNKQPVDIIILTYHRLPYLKELVWMIKERTEYPYRLIVVDNRSRDGTKRWIKKMHRKGEIWKYVFMKRNEYMTNAFAEGFKKVESDLFIVTQDDVIPPETKPCWLTRMVELIKNNKEYVSISMGYRNISFERHLCEQFGGFKMKNEIDLIARYASACGRIQRKDDFTRFVNNERYRNGKTTGESHSYGRFMRKLIKKKTGEAVKIICQHLETKNKGYPEGFTEYETYDPKYK